MDSGCIFLMLNETLNSYLHQPVLLIHATALILTFRFHSLICFMNILAETFTNRDLLKIKIQELGRIQLCVDQEITNFIKPLVTCAHQRISRESDQEFVHVCSHMQHAAGDFLHQTCSQMLESGWCQQEVRSGWREGLNVGVSPGQSALFQYSSASRIKSR